MMFDPQTLNAFGIGCLAITVGCLAVAGIWLEWRLRRVESMSNDHERELEEIYEKQVEDPKAHPYGRQIAS